MNRLQAFVHVSTAYANCNRSRQELSLPFFSNFPCCPCYELYSSEATQTRSSILPRLLQESMRFRLWMLQEMFSLYFFSYMIQAANICRALSLLKTLPPSTLDSPDVTKKILGDRPNTYTFTKVKRFYHQSFQNTSFVFIGHGRTVSARRGCGFAHLHC